MISDQFFCHFLVFNHLHFSLFQSRHIGAVEVPSFAECEGVSLGVWFPTFRRNLLPPASGLRTQEEELYPQQHHHCVKTKPNE